MKSEHEETLIGEVDEHGGHIAWVEFTRRTEDPKLGWLERRLDDLGIRHKREGASRHAPILWVPQEHENEAWSILNEKWGRKTVDDIDDDDPRFLR